MSSRESDLRRVTIREPIEQTAGIAQLARPTRAITCRRVRDIIGNQQAFPFLDDVITASVRYK